MERKGEEEEKKIRGEEKYKRKMTLRSLGLQKATATHSPAAGDLRLPERPSRPESPTSYPHKPRLLPLQAPPDSPSGLVSQRRVWYQSAASLPPVAAASRLPAGPRG